MSLEIDEFNVPLLQSFEECSPDDFLEHLVNKYKLNTTKLRTAVKSAYREYTCAVTILPYMPIFWEAQSKVKDPLKALQEIKRSWDQQHYREHLPKLGYDTSDILIPIGAIMEELERYHRLPQRRGGRSSHSRDELRIDLELFYSAVRELDEFWINEKGTHLGVNYQLDLPNEHDKTGNETLGDAGLLFAHACLLKLDPRLLRRHVSTIINDVRNNPYSSKPTKAGVRAGNDLY